MEIRMPHWPEEMGLPTLVALPLITMPPSARMRVAFLLSQAALTRVEMF
jgi:hypothetical protein